MYWRTNSLGRSFIGLKTELWISVLLCVLSSFINLPGPPFLHLPKVGSVSKTEGPPRMAQRIQLCLQGREALESSKLSAEAHLIIIHLPVPENSLKRSLLYLNVKAVTNLKKKKNSLVLMWLESISGLFARRAIGNFASITRRKERDVCVIAGGMRGWCVLGRLPWLQPNLVSEGVDFRWTRKAKWVTLCWDCAAQRNPGQIRMKASPLFRPLSSRLGSRV